MEKSKITRLLYNGLQWTWGLPQTLAGAGLYLKHRKDPHFAYKGAKVTAWDRDEGISLGRYIFVPASGKKRAQADASAKTGKDKAEPAVSEFLLNHEYGHTIQSLILGPLYLLLVGLPSFAWNRLPYFDRKRRKTGRSYYSAIFERTASEFGEKAANRRAERNTGNNRKPEN